MPERIRQPHVAATPRVQDRVRQHQFAVALAEVELDDVDPHLPGRVERSQRVSRRQRARATVPDPLTGAVHPEHDVISVSPMATNGANRGGAVVTGGARGLGFEIARQLAQRRFTVNVTDVDGEAATQAAARLGPPAFASELDVRDEDACREAARATHGSAGSLEVWVNNAGVLVTGPAWEQDAAIRRLMLEVNAIGTINGTLAALELMRPEGRGHIVNVISLAGIVAAPGEAVYAASKHAAIGFSLATL